MDASTVLGIFLLGAAVGALLTAIAYRGRIHELREHIHRIAAGCEKQTKCEQNRAAA